MSKKSKRKILRRLTDLQVRDMMENKLKSSTIPSGTLYNRSEEKEEILNQMDGIAVLYTWECPRCHMPTSTGERGDVIHCDDCKIQFVAGED